jgi:hypothetical protein
VAVNAQTDYITVTDDSGGVSAASGITVDSTTLVGVGTTAQAVFEELDDAVATDIAALATHAAAADPHTGYRLESADHTHASSGLQGGVVAAYPVAQTLTLYATAGTWTDQPSATTEFLGVTSHRHQFDFTNVTQARFKARVTTAGLSGAYIRPQYSSDDITYAILASSSTDFDISLTAAGTKRSAWANIAAGAKIDPVYIRIVGADGNSTADPVIAQISLEVR